MQHPKQKNSPVKSGVTEAIFKKCAKQEKVLVTNKTQEIDVSEYVEGMYIIQLRTKSEIIIKRIVIE